MIRPLQYAIYKGTGGKHGCLQFNLQRPHFYKDKTRDFAMVAPGQALDETGRIREGWQAREGAIFMEITSTKDKNVYDWDNKIVMALSVNDMGKLLETLVTGTELKLMHYPGAKSETAGVVKKYLTVSSPKGIKEGCLFMASQTSGGETKTHMVPVAPSEVYILRSLINAAIAKSLAW